MTNAIKEFRKLLEVNAQFPILLLSGDAKLGKTHLMTKVFPKIVNEENSKLSIVLDLRDKTQKIPELLDLLCNQIAKQCNDSKLFKSYDLARQNSSSMSIKVEDCNLILANMEITVDSGAENEHMKMVVGILTKAFIDDLKEINDVHTILLLDQFDNATDEIKDWLMHKLLANLVCLTRLRVVIAGRSVSNPSGSYSSKCSSFELSPVKDVNEYINFCRRLGIGSVLSDQTITEFAKVFDYKPGMFADLVLPKYLQQ